MLTTACWVFFTTGANDSLTWAESLGARRAAGGGGRLGAGGEQGQQDDAQEIRAHGTFRQSFLTQIINQRSGRKKGASGMPFQADDVEGAFAYRTASTRARRVRPAATRMPRPGSSSGLPVVIAQANTVVYRLGPIRPVMLWMPDM